ncbi:MAG: DUF4175 domain-containing protein [Actinobacteria bacterium]|nr:DUF4175 domain-containing protein [Actinomycetota bacterium]
MFDQSGGLLTKLWRLSLTILGVVFALWLSVRLLTQIWWVLVIIGMLVIVTTIAIRWWRIRRW